MAETAKQMNIYQAISKCMEEMEDCSTTMFLSVDLTV